MLERIQSISRAFVRSPLVIAIAISAVFLSPLAWKLPIASATIQVVAPDLSPVPVLYTRDDPWTVIVVPTISYRGDHYGKIKASADKSESERIEHLRKDEKKPKKQKRSSVDDAIKKASQSALLAYAKAAIGKRGPQLGLPSSLWCQDFINFVLRKVGLPTTGSRMARSSLTHPQFVRVAKPVPGDIVVISRGRSSVYGHVALYNGSCGKGGIRMLGGNQGGGRVTDQCVYGRNVVGYVRPKAIVTDTIQVASNDKPPKVAKVKAKKRVVKRIKHVVRHATVEKPYWTNGEG